MGNNVITRAIKSQDKPKTINNVVLLELNEIFPNKSQPRKCFAIEEIESLAQSITENGLIQPLTVRKVLDGGYELISGERRLRAIKLTHLEKAPCIIIDVTDKQSAVLALLENIQRSDLNYFEEANALKSLIVEWGLSQAELGTRLGKAQPTIANKLRLLHYDETLQAIMLANSINERQARALLKIKNDSALIDAIKYIGEHKLSVAQTERYVETLESNPNPTSKQTSTPIVKDVRLFFNTINNAIKLMNDSGINASAEKIESGDYIEYVVKIPLANPISR